MAEKYEYDLLVIGSGPGGQKAAVQAAKLGKRVGLIDLNPTLGGVCLHDGTIPSKSFREAILHLTGYRVRERFGKAYRVKQNILMEDLSLWSSGIIAEIEQTLRAQMQRNHVQLIAGFGSFVDSHRIRVSHRNKSETLSADKIVIATGTSPRRPEGFIFDDEVILDSNGVLYMENIPQSLAIVGGGVIGCEYGSMFAALGCKVTIIEAQPRILGFLDREIVETLSFHLREHRVQIRTSEKVVRCQRSSDGRAIIYLESGKRLVSDKLLVSAGRVGNTEKLGLERIGIKVDERDLISVNDSFQTAAPNVYAVGDVIGFPALASTAMEQGRLAVLSAFGIEENVPPQPFSYGIFTIPEIAAIGKTEEQLSADRVPYEIGTARFEEVERGMILGISKGGLKLLFHRETRKILGIHIIGEGAIEMIHIGQCVIAMDGTLSNLVHMIFNYPTLSQAYKIAALDGINKLMAMQGIEPDEI
ncbi:MAG: Si-specific NAD(P)(+) transhydrogenase [Bdellovibrionales bacterium]|nr:Si-specific NAD(P)(+) transhydrogenase [Bdellovibrionales bacterium]